MDLFECVANISAGRDLDVVNQCRTALAAQNVEVLHCDVGYDADRSVITFVGNQVSIEAGILALAQKSYELIDVRLNQGNHPHIGSLDVCPIIPLLGATMEQAVAISQRVAEQIWRDFSVPVFLYANSSLGDSKVKMPSHFRCGGYEHCRERVCSGALTPDIGTRWNDRNGATILGARSLMVACNFSLSTESLPIAQRIAAEVRQLRSGRDHEFRYLTGLDVLGWYQQSRGVSQISMNLRRLDLNHLGLIYNLVSTLATRTGHSIIGTEFIGLVPEEVLRQAEMHLNLQSVNYQRLLGHIGAHAFGEFIPSERILDRRLSQILENS